MLRRCHAASWICRQLTEERLGGCGVIPHIAEISDDGGSRVRQCRELCGIMHDRWVPRSYRCCSSGVDGRQGRRGFAVLYRDGTLSEAGRQYLRLEPLTIEVHSQSSVGVLGEVFLVDEAVQHLGPRAAVSAGAKGSVGVMTSRMARVLRCLGGEVVALAAGELDLGDDVHLAPPEGLVNHSTCRPHYYLPRVSGHTHTLECVCIQAP